MDEEKGDEMHIDVVASVNELRQEDVLFKTVIVIDTLRATSSMITGVAQGVDEIIPVETIGQAKSLLAQDPSYLLAGERNSKKIPGFHLGNSPSEWLSVPLKAQRIIFTTTNGTRAILKAAKADQTLIGSFLNGQSCAKQAIIHQADITILCAGTRNQFAIEDGLAAGYLIDWLLQMAERITINDLGWTLYHAYRASRPRLTEVIQQGQTGQRLLQLGCLDDLTLCCQLDKYPVVAHFKPPSIIGTSIGT